MYEKHLLKELSKFYYDEHADIIYECVKSIEKPINNVDSITMLLLKDVETYKIISHKPSYVIRNYVPVDEHSKVIYKCIGRRILNE